MIATYPVTGHGRCRSSSPTTARAPASPTTRSGASSSCCCSTRGGPSRVCSRASRPPIEDGTYVGGLPFVTSLAPGWCEDGSYPWVCALEWWVHSGQAPPVLQREHKRELQQCISDLETLVALEEEEQQREQRKQQQQQQQHGGGGEEEEQEEEGGGRRRRHLDLHGAAPSGPTPTCPRAMTMTTRRNNRGGGKMVRMKTSSCSSAGTLALGHEPRTKRTTMETNLLRQTTPPRAANYNWAEAIPEEWRELDWSDIENWLRETKKNAVIEEDVEVWLRGVNFSTLMEKQKHAVAVVKSYLTDSSKGQLLMHIMGTAGTGKTWTVMAICKMIIEQFGGPAAEGANGSRYVLATPTGTAAFLINGQTLHSLLNLPSEHVTILKHLGKDALQRLQALWEGKLIAIIDEQSMVGRRTLGQINRRLKEIKCNDRGPFGGLHVVLVGDNGQLPPVRDKPKIDNRRTTRAMISVEDATAAMVYREFKVVVKLDVAMRHG